jgi:hypothetical protein
MRIFRRLRLSRWWGQAYERGWGGLKGLVVPNRAGVHTIRRGPGRGIRILTNPAHGGTRILLGLYEPQLMRWMSAVIRPGDVVYDVGTADGHEALIAAKLVGPTGRVIGFEPNPAIRGMLDANLARNPELASRITVLPHFVGATHDPAANVVSIDGLCCKDNPAALPVPHAVKIDVDGPEREVLAGMQQLARAACPHAFVECHIEPAVEEAVRDFFRGLNIPTERSDPSVFDVARNGFNTWVWTTGHL